MSSECVDKAQKFYISSDKTITRNSNENAPEFVSVKQEVDTEHENISVKIEPQDNTSDYDSAEKGHNTITIEITPIIDTTEVIVKAEPLDYCEDQEQAGSENDNDHEEGARSQQSDYSPKSDKYHCLICEKSFCSKGNLERHNRNHNRETYFCEICPRLYYDPEKLATHMSQHKSDNKDYKCDQCNRICKTSSLLHRHKRSHLIVKPFDCDLCGKTFAFKANLEKHRGKSRCKIPILLSCNVCDKTFQREYLLKSHLRRHTTEKPFTCDLCQMKFKHKTTLIRHMQLHAGIKPYTCKFCGKSFTHYGLMKPHMRIHTGEKPYQCPICSKEFSHKHNMQRHTQRHEKVKNLTCTVCNKKFPKESRLKYHMKIHVSEKHFPCFVCTKKFSHRQNILRHYKRKHPGITYDCKETDASVALKVWDEVVNLKTRQLDRIPEKEIYVPIKEAVPEQNPLKFKDDMTKMIKEKKEEYIVPDNIGTLTTAPVVVKIEKCDSSDVELENS